jgi:transposase
MPWKIITVIRARQRLVESMLARRKSYRELFRDFGVSRATAYKWFTRFHAQGMTGLHNHSRRPRRSPRTLASQWVRKIDQWRRRRPHWGAKKIHRQLRRESPGFRLPCVRTIQRWLHRLGHVQPRKRRARKGPLVPHPGLTHPTKTNQVWTVDFKGWFCTGDGVRQEPLTVRDLFSRYGLCLQLLPNQDDQGVRRTMQRLFRRSGLPEAIRVDNGSPFSGWDFRVFQCGGFAWVSESNSLAGRGRETMPLTNSSMVAINAKWWTTEPPIVRPCSVAPIDGCALIIRNGLMNR